MHILYDSVSPLADISPETLLYMITRIFITAEFVKSEKTEPTQMTTDRRMVNLWYIHTVEYSNENTST